MKTWSLPVHLSGAIAAGMTPVAARPSRKAGPRTEQSVFATIDAHIQRQRKTAKVPGLALGIVQGVQILYLRGYGKADESGRAVTPRTPFLIGSTTKSFTALAIMQLVEAGMIELDAPIQRYIPWFRVADPIASARITVRHLLNQTSGLSTAAGVLYGLSGSLTRSLEERVRSLRTAKLDRPVGDSFEYSNANYLILGCLIQAVSHQPYEVYIQRHIFQPLEMHHSYVSEEQAKRHGLATGYRFWFGFPFPWNTPFPLGAVPEGGLLSTAEDMCHYLSLYLNEGRYRGKALLSPAGIAQMERATVTANMFADVWGGQKRTTSYYYFVSYVEGGTV
jgi:CubicO group peptidase (beta-lactamase class C family)